MAYHSICRKLITQVMIDYEGLDAGIIHKGGGGTTALIHHDNVLGILGSHCFSLLFVMYALPFSDKMDIYQ